jgi:penicillin-binding protein 1C
LQDALRLRDRPDFPDRSLLARNPPRIAWKTGTSFGNRDAWAVGSGRTFTVVVWLGNLDQSPSAHLVGAEAAAPMLFNLLEALRDAQEDDPAPPEVAPARLCALSGRLPNEACPRVRAAPALVDKLPPDRCALHLRLDIDGSTGHRLTAVCEAPHERSPEVVVTWPAGVERWLGGTFAGVRSLPRLAPDCAATSTRGGPRIRTPAATEIIVLLPGVATTEQQVPLQADAPSGTELAWYVDGRFLARASVSERVWWTPAPGAHQVVVMDPGGGTASRTVVVRGPTAGTSVARMDVRQGR